MPSPNPNPINYNTTFGRIGKFVKDFNIYLGLQNTAVGLSTIVDIDTQFAARPDLVAGLPSAFSGYQSNVQTWCQGMKSYTDAILQDLQVNLSAPSTSVSTIIPLLIEDMTLNSQTVQKNTLSALNITSGVLVTGGNIGTGFLLGSQNTSAGIPDERIITEYVVFTCTTDQYGGATAGGETFSITGYPSQQYYVGNLNRGNGVGTAITVANEGGTNFLFNGDFSNTASPFPSGWNFNVGTGFVSSNASAGHSATSLSSLQINGNASSGVISFNQSIASSVQTYSTYAAGAFLRKAGTVSSGSNLQVAVTGTGYSTANLFNADPSTLTTTYALESLFFNVGATIPPDLSLSIIWTAASNAGSGAIVLIDDIAVVTPTNFGNVQYVLYRGTVDFLAGDSFGVLTSDNYAGIFQTYFGRAYGVGLPSSGSPSIADSLAT